MVIGMHHRTYLVGCLLFNVFWGLSSYPHTTELSPQTNCGSLNVMDPHKTIGSDTIKGCGFLEYCGFVGGSVAL